MAESRTARAYYGSSQGTVVLELHGQLRYIVARALRISVETLLAQGGFDCVVIDLRRVELIDSTGLGVLARIARAALVKSGRRAVLVCPENDVATSLRSASFHELCAMVESSPVDHAVPLEEIPVASALSPAMSSTDEKALGRVILDAHRDLASLSRRNRESYREVIAALEADLRARR